MTSAREALEAAVRRQLDNIRKRPHTANECTDAILTAVDTYTAASAPGRVTFDATDSDVYFVLVVALEEWAADQRARAGADPAEEWRLRKVKLAYQMRQRVVTAASGEPGGGTDVPDPEGGNG